MIKRWLVKCKVNMDASNEINVIVKSNNENKAKSIAVSKCYKKGYFHVDALSCKEVKNEDETI
jgi:hypothetical protein